MATDVYEDAIREDERRRCAADLCHWCAEGVPRNGYGAHAHGNSRRCFAENIWRRAFREMADD